MTEEKIRISRLRAQFLRRNIKVVDDWLEDCFKFFIEEIPNITDDQLLENAMQQYLLGNLADIGLPSIPEVVLRVGGNQIVEGKFVVQVQSIMDVSQSAYEQLQNLYNKKVDTTIDEESESRAAQPKNSKKNRMLSLELTDGTTTIDAMEYQPIPSLNEKMQPGLKIRIVGPLNCRNHILFLEEKNVEVLGGEVDILLIENAFENMLLKKINRPVNPNPQKEYETVALQRNSILRQTPNIPPPSLNIRSNQPAIASAPMSNVSVPASSSSSSRATAPASSSRSTAPIMNNTNAIRNVNASSNQNFNQQITHVVSDPFDDDDILLDVDLNAIETQPQTSTRPTTSRASIDFDPQPSTSRGPPKSTYDDFYDDDEDDLDALMAIENQMFTEQNACPNLDESFNRPGSSNENVGIKRLSSSPTNLGPPFKVRKEDTNVQNEFNHDFDEFDALVFQSQAVYESPPLPPPVLIPEAKYDATDYKYRLEGCNVLTFEQLYKIPMEDWPGKIFMFYAGIDSVLKTICISNSQWTMDLLLTDGNQFEVHMDPILLEKMIEYSAQEIKLMKTKAAHQPALREEIITILKKFNDTFNTLKTVNRFWKIKFPEENSSDQTPTVISISDLKPVYKKILLRKIEAEQLYELRKRIPD